MTLKEIHIKRMNTADDRRLFVWLLLVLFSALLWTIALAPWSIMVFVLLYWIAAFIVGVAWTSHLIFTLDNSRKCPK